MYSRFKIFFLLFEKAKGLKLKLQVYNLLLLWTSTIVVLSLDASNFIVLLFSQKKLIALIGNAFEKKKQKTVLKDKN